MEFAKIIKNLRLQNEYTQVYVASILNVTQGAYQKYENDRARPEYEKLIKLADLYDVSVDYLLGRKEI